MNELTKHRQTALHLAAQQDLPTICSVLLENGVDFAATDENGNNGKSVSFPCVCAECLKKSPFSEWGRTPPLGLLPLREVGFQRSRAVTGNALNWASNLPLTRPGQPPSLNGNPNSLKWLLVKPLNYTFG